MTKPRYNAVILAVPWHFVIPGFHCSCYCPRECEHIVVVILNIHLYVPIIPVLLNVFNVIFRLAFSSITDQRTCKKQVNTEQKPTTKRVCSIVCFSYEWQQSQQKQTDRIKAPDVLIGKKEVKEGNPQQWWHASYYRHYSHFIYPNLLCWCLFLPARLDTFLFFL